MPTGKIDKIVHLSLQSSASADCSPALKGYGYILPDEGDERIYFEPKAVKLYSFDDLLTGQQVEFDRDPKYPVAKSVELKEPILAPAATSAGTD